MNLLLQRCTNIFTPSDVRNVLSGLQKTKCDNPIILKILSSLNLRIKLIDTNFTNQNVSDCLNGLQGINSSHLETREIISSLIPHINKCGDNLKKSKNQINNQQILLI